MLPLPVERLALAFLFVLSGLAAPVAAQSVMGFTLVDATTNADLGPLTDGQVVEAFEGLNVRADVSGAVGSVRFGFDGDPNYSTESVAPYALAGDSGGNYNPLTLGSGTYVLTATPYTGAGASGDAGAPLTITFSVSGSSGGGGGDGGGGGGGGGSGGGGDVEITGELKRWHPVTLTFEGPSVSESQLPSVFLDYRLNVEITTPSGQALTVPGFFAADGDAANSSASSGDQWRVHFTPDQPGSWS
ncbi:MAG: DUF5060 domain-containing protein, partial [Rhodothermales bacterium]|nr:DUF5060 domain-containing protein [Rhodothermales bacterium]